MCIKEQFTEGQLDKQQEPKCEAQQKRRAPFSCTTISVMAQDGPNHTLVPTGEANPDECSDIQLDNTSKFFMVFLYSVCCVCASGGNVGVIRAVTRTAALQTLSNYFLVSLATADLFIGLAMNPIYIAFATLELNVSLWIVEMENVLWIATVAASTLSLSAVSVDRYIAITSPLRYPEVMTERRCFVTILSIWVFSFAFASSRLAIHDFKKLEKLWITTSVVTVIIPIAIIAFCYFHIFKAVRVQSRIIRVTSVGRDSNSTQRQDMQIKKNRKAAFTMAIVIGLFLLLFLPSVVIFCMLYAVSDPCEVMLLNVAWLWGAGVSFAHSAINPWIYALRSSEFRKALRRVFLCKEM